MRIISSAAAVTPRQDGVERRQVAVVSGLGPNGFLAALTLQRQGFIVQVVEKRATATRPIHLGLRASYLARLKELAPEVHRALARCMAPVSDAARALPTSRAEGEATRLLDEPVVAIARLDELESIMRAHIATLEQRGCGLTYTQGELRVTPSGPSGAHSARVMRPDGREGAFIHEPTLIVLAEGGRSVNAAALGLVSDTYSPVKRYLSAHTSRSVGAKQLFLPSPHGAAWAAGAAACIGPSWITGHSEASKGAWLVVEVGHDAKVDDAAARTEVLAAATGQLDAAAPVDSTFTGTFAFQQQMRSAFIAGSNVVVFGDAGGMGHHAYSSGTVMGLCDADALATLGGELRRGAAPEAGLLAYDRAITRSRMELMAYGMQQYDSAAGPATIDAIARERSRKQEARRAARVASTDGLTALDDIITSLARRVALGERCALVVDIDGTLVDTRPRALAALHVYGRTDLHIDDLTQTAPTCEDVARDFGLDVTRLKPIWESVVWQYDGFAQDRTIDEVASRIARAHEAGIQIVLASGRRSSLEQATKTDLARRGIHYDTLCCKPRGVRTVDFKTQVVRDLRAQGVYVGACVGDTRDEVETVGRSAGAPGLVVTATPSQAPRSIVVGARKTPRRVVGSARAVTSNAAALRTWIGLDGVAKTRTVERVATHGLPIEFGAEVEYERGASQALLAAYRPATGVAAETWDAWTHDERWQWVMRCVPTPWEGTIELPMVRHRIPEGLEFLPETLVLDGTGNLEIVLPKVDALEELERRAHAVVATFGAGSWQGMVSAPRPAFFGDADVASRKRFEGFLNFYSLHDTFARLDLGATMLERMPDAEVMRPFLHAFLGPLTAGKQRFMRDYLEANRVGERLDGKWFSLVRRAWSSFKYIGGTAYRPDVAGADRPALEVRDCKHVPLLIERMTRATYRIMHGFDAFEPFAEVTTFDSEADYARLSPEVRRMLERVVPSAEKTELASMYSRCDRVALQVYRNFALPVKDYGDLAVALGGSAYSRVVGAASNAYIATLEALASAHASGAVGDTEARRDVQAALATFARDSGLAERLATWDRRHLVAEPKHAAQIAMQLDGLAPLGRAFPTLATPAPLTDRLRALAARWPEHVRLAGRDLVISVAGLDAERRQQLVRDYRDSVAHNTVSVRASATGDLDVRLGVESFEANRPAAEAAPYEPGFAHDEVMLELSPLESMRLRHHVARHAPLAWMSGGVAAPSWVRHFAIGAEGQSLERHLGLAARPVGESPAALVQAIGETDRALRVRWTEQALDAPITEHALFESADAVRTGSLTQRLADFAARWPDNVRLVAKARYSANGKEGRRDTLIVSRHGLGTERVAELARDYVSAVAHSTLSFPLSEGAYHLRARVGAATFSFARDGMHAASYMPAMRPRLEPLVMLSDAEANRLREYTRAALDDTLEVIGPHTAYDGPTQVNGSITNNRPTDDARHNCTSWVTTAPIGDHGEPLHTLLGMPADWPHDNAGWLSLFLTTSAPLERSPVAVLWRDDPLPAPGASDAIAWDFNPQ